MVDLDDLSLDSFSDDDSDSEEEEEDDDDTEYQIYTDKTLSKDYILKYRNTSLYEPIMLPHYTGPAKKIMSSCRSENRPSIIQGDTLKILLENEATNKIKHNKKV